MQRTQQVASVVGMLIAVNFSAITLFPRNGLAMGLLSTGWRQRLREVPFAFEIPPLLSRESIQEFSRILVLSEAQQQYVRIMYDEYSTATETAANDRIGKLLSAAHVLVASRGASQAHSAPAFVKVREIEDDLCAVLDSEADKFLSRIEAILSDSQRPLAERVRWYVQRGRSMPELFKIRKARVDLVELLKRAGLTSETSERAWAIQIEYERHATPLFVNAGRVLRRNKPAIEDARRLQEFDDFDLPLDMNDGKARARALESLAREEAMFRECGTAEKRIAEANEQFFSRLLAQMPSEEGDRFLSLFRAAVYRQVYPDPIDPKSLFERLTERADLTPDIKTLLRDQWTQYRTMYESLCHDMCEESDRWQEQGAMTGESNGSQDHNDRMFGWKLQRAKMNQAIVKTITEMLPNEVQDRVRIELDDWKKHASLFIDSLLSKPRNYVDFS